MSDLDTTALRAILVNAELMPPGDFISEMRARVPALLEENARLESLLTCHDCDGRGGRDLPGESVTCSTCKGGGRSLSDEVVDTIARIEVERDAALVRAPPAPGSRCPWCHRNAPNLDGCARCNPEQLGARLADALARAEKAETSSRHNREAWGKAESHAKRAERVAEERRVELAALRARLARCEAVVQAARKWRESWIDGDGYGRVESVNLKTALDALGEQP